MLSTVTIACHVVYCEMVRNEIGSDDGMQSETDGCMDEIDRVV